MNENIIFVDLEQSGVNPPPPTGTTIPANIEGLLKGGNCEDIHQKEREDSHMREREMREELDRKTEEEQAQREERETKGRREREHKQRVEQDVQM